MKLVPEEQKSRIVKLKKKCSQISSGIEYKIIIIQFQGFNTRSSEKSVKSNQIVNEGY
jgi:hypothetical protein